MQAPSPDELPDIPIMEDAYKANPYPYYRRWADAPPFWGRIDGAPVVVATRFRDVSAVYRDHERFSSVKPPFPGMERFDFFNGLQDLVHTDPPDHTRLRTIIAPAFTPRAVATMESRVSALVRTRFTGIRGRGSFEVMADFARQLSVELMLGIVLGMKEKDYPIFTELSGAMALLNDLSPGDSKPKAYLDAWQRAREYCDRVIADNRNNPGENVIGRVVAAHEKGGMSADELLVMLMGLFLGGLSTVATLIGSCFVQLVSRPGQYRLLCDNPHLAANAVEEVLRYDSPGLFNYKFASRDLEFEGLSIPGNTTVYIIHAATGFDPEVFDDPFRFDIRRKLKPHLIFGRGIHLCIGAPIARLTARVVLETAAALLPFVDFADDEPIRYGGWQQERAPEAVRLLVGERAFLRGEPGRQQGS